MCAAKLSMMATANATPQMSKGPLELDLGVALAVTELCPDVEVCRGVAVVLATEVVVLIGDVSEDAEARSQPYLKVRQHVSLDLERD